MSFSTIERFKSGELHINETVYKTIMHTFKKGEAFYFQNVADAIYCQGVDVVDKNSVCKDAYVIGKNQIKHCLSDWSKKDWMFLKRLGKGRYARQWILT